MNNNIRFAYAALTFFCLLLLFVVIYIFPMTIIEYKITDGHCEELGKEYWSNFNTELVCLEDNQLAFFSYKCDWGLYDVKCKFVALGDLK